MNILKILFRDTRLAITMDIDIRQTDKESLRNIASELENIAAIVREITDEP